MFDLKKDVGNGQGAKKKVWIIIAGVLAVFLFLMGILWTLVLNAMDDEPNKVDETNVSIDPGLQTQADQDNAITKWKEAQARREAEELERQAREKARRQKEDQQRQSEAPSPQAKGKTADTASAAQTKTPKERKLGSTVVATVNTMSGSSYGASSTGRDSNGQARQSSNGDATASLESGGGLSSGSAAGSRGSLGGLGATPFAPTKAYLAPDGKYLLRNNTYARCALYTEVITEHESLLTCYLVAPLYSSDGSTLLADAGSRMTGEQRIEMKPGQAQVFTQWNDLEVESGQPGVPNVRVRFDALGTGPMGSSGTKGWIDNKVVQRYGGAIVLSGFKDLLQAVVNSTQKGGSGYTINNSEQNVEDIASKTLDANININPVGYLLPGTVINVTIARDIDFSPVYENR